MKSTAVSHIQNFGDAPSSPLRDAACSAGDAVSLEGDAVSLEGDEGASPKFWICDTTRYDLYQFTG